MKVTDLPTPALIIETKALEHNLRTMAAVLPGPKLRPHIKAHKTTRLAHRQAQIGHRGFTCATAREVVGMANAGLGDDLLLANECLDESRLEAMARCGARVTVAVDSEATIGAAAKGRIREVLVDVNIGLPRCGCPPDDAGRLADLARKRGLEVRGVMGYEGHLMAVADRETRAAGVEHSMQQLLSAHEKVGGEVVSAGGTGSYDINRWATEIQAGSYALMDTDYGKLELPFRQALFVVSTVISRCPGFSVGDCGLKALGMDHGNPSISGANVLFCSDEHVTFVPDSPVEVGSRVRVTPAHVDPTVAKHERVHLVDDEDVLDTWEVDLRGW